MDCTEAQSLLDQYLHRELDGARGEGLEQHLADCQACDRARRQMQSLRQAARALRDDAPAALIARVRDLVGDDLHLRQAHSLRLWRSIAIAACLVAACSISWIFLNRPAHPANRLLADEIIASHVRSLMGDHLLDVVSSDQHSVKPWFNGRLDFSPEVRDFAAQGFPLLGGRVDYLAGRSVAALVYGYRKHRINVYTWPASDRAIEPFTLSRQGYHILLLRHEGPMTWCLVSDASEPTLRQLANLIQQPAPAASEPAR